MTLQERFEVEKNAKKVFYERCMKAAMVKEMTVRCWLKGTRRPDDLAKLALAREFGCTVEELFPESIKTQEK